MTTVAQTSPARKHRHEADRHGEPADERRGASMDDAAPGVRNSSAVVVAFSPKPESGPRPWLGTMKPLTTMNDAHHQDGDHQQRPRLARAHVGDRHHLVVARRLDQQQPAEGTAAVTANHTSAGGRVPAAVAPPLDRNSVMPPTVSAMRTAPIQSIRPEPAPPASSGGQPPSRPSPAR